MDLFLKGTRALVTGSTAGIGFAIALALAKEGASVTINGRSEERVWFAVEKIRGEVPEARVEGATADLSSAEGVNQLIQLSPEADVLVNNLGIYEMKPFEEIADEDWFRLFETNVMSGVRLASHYLPRMKVQDWGRVIFVSSESALNVPKEMIHYAMTKMAQLVVARGLAEATTGTRVTVNSILPGPTKSEGVTTLTGNLAKKLGSDLEAVEKAFLATARPASLLRRFITPGEVANLAVFLCSPLSSAINGSALRVDGGAFRSIM